MIKGFSSIRKKHLCFSIKNTLEKLHLAIFSLYNYKDLFPPSITLKPLNLFRFKRWKVIQTPILRLLFTNCYTAKFTISRESYKNHDI